MKRILSAQSTQIFHHFSLLEIKEAPYRRTNGILSNDTDPIIDSQVIVTAITLGFSYWFLSHNTPFKFETNENFTRTDKGIIESDSIVPSQLNEAIRKINLAMINYEPSLNISISIGNTPPYKPENVIIGTPYNRVFAPYKDISDFSKTTQELHELICLNTPTDEFPALIGYRDRGAYMGATDKPRKNKDHVDHVSITCTTQKLTPPDSVHGERWVPPKYPHSSYTPWGSLGITLQQNSMPLRINNMVLEKGKGNDCVGYEHGMILAFIDAKAHGEDATPLEIAVGFETKKLASCLGCSIYMHANGFSPSSTHLGSSDS